MKMPEEVNTRKFAMIEEAGWSPAQVLADSFDVEGFDVIGTYPDLGKVRLANDELPRTRIEWPNETTRRRAEAAMNDDFEERFGVSIGQALPRRTHI